MSVETKCKYVLCITGGGIRDVFPAQFLDNMRTKLDLNMSKFDLIVGVSGGALLALYTAANIDKLDAKILNQKPLKFIDLFSQVNLRKMCDKSRWDHIMGEIQFSPVYDGKGKVNVLKKYFENSKLGEYKTRVAVPIYNITKKTTEIFTTYDEECKNYTTWSVADATSAAVPYYPAVKLKNGDKYIDGGYSSCNPVLIAYSEAQRLFGTQTPIRMLSLGTGYQDYGNHWQQANVEEWGAIQWICNGLLDLVMDAPNELALEQTQKIMSMHGNDNRLLHINIPIRQIKIDDTTEESVNHLINAGHQAFQSYQSDLVDFLNPKSCRAWNSIRKSVLPPPLPDADI
jgi:predicted patatin/cPLA2 family phospholipase